MCNINILMNKKKINTSKINEVMNVISYYSFYSNDDGEGFLSLGKNDFLSSGKNLTKKHYDVKRWFLVTHQRLSTSGFNKKNTQPIETKNLIVIHNGVFHDLGNSKKSDTWFFSRRLEKLYDEFGGDIVRVIKQITREVMGSYSVVVFDKNTERAYYFKESSTQMFFCEDKEWFVASTSEKNVGYAKHQFDINSEIFKLKSGVIFDLFRGCVYLDEFDECELYCDEEYWLNYYGGGYFRYGFDSSQNKNPKIKYLEEFV